MAREKEGYRDNLELLNIRYPDHDMLTMQEVMTVTGYTSRNTVLKHLGDKFGKNKKLCKTKLANWMCG